MNENQPEDIIDDLFDFGYTADAQMPSSDINGKKTEKDKESDTKSIGFKDDLNLIEDTISDFVKTTPSIEATKPPKKRGRPPKEKKNDKPDLPQIAKDDISDSNQIDVTDPEISKCDRLDDNIEKPSSNTAHSEGLETSRLNPELNNEMAEATLSVNNTKQEDEIGLKETKKVNITKIETSDDLILKNMDLQKWYLTSPAPKYDSFYEIKKQIINVKFNNKMLELDVLRDEVREINIEPGNLGFDCEKILDKMDYICIQLQRLSQLVVDINFDLFYSEQTVKSLQGYLARVEYLKPNLRQEGINIVHISDVQYYYKGLSALKDTINIKINALESALNILNRRLTISQKDVDISHYDKWSFDSNKKRKYDIKNSESDDVSDENEEMIAPTKEPDFMDSFNIPDKPVRQNENQDEKSGQVRIGWDL